LPPTKRSRAGFVEALGICRTKGWTQLAPISAQEHATRRLGAKIISRTSGEVIDIFELYLSGLRSKSTVWNAGEPV
jgi:hypothetical protein